MWRASGTCKSTFNKLLLKYNIPTKPGQSGSPITKTKNGETYVIGVHLGNRLGKKEKKVGMRLNREKRNMINYWVGEITKELNLSKFSFTKMGLEVEINL